MSFSCNSHFNIIIKNSNSRWRLDLHNLQSQSLELVTIAIVINVVIGGFRGET